MDALSCNQSRMWGILVIVNEGRVAAHGWTAVLQPRVKDDGHMLSVIRPHLCESAISRVMEDTLLELDEGPASVLVAQN
jgi:hypothetical protein